MQNTSSSNVIMNSFWDVCQARFRASLTQQQFSTWIKPLVFNESDSQIQILAPNHFVMDWVREKFADHIEGWAKEHFARPIAIVYALGKRSVAPKAEAAPEATPLTASGMPQQERRTVAAGMRINASFNFDNFVSGRANQLARAASLQIAENPGHAYNPLFIYGGVGLGKTHLLQAIGNTVREANPHARISYIHATDYVDDVVKAYLNKQFDDLKRRYMSLDLLLVDDIQFLAKKDRSQEEFFYAFNSLIENKKLVITCDTFPKEINGLDDRLKSRFAWGLTVAVEPPELEMRVAILLSKAVQENAKLDENVAFFIAKQVRSNVRELEGALKRVIAFSRFHEKTITLELAKEALRDLIASTSRIVSVENIQKTVADFYKIKVADMYSKTRTRNLARPRQIAMALAKELTNLSLPEIGESFGGRDHTTVLHACRKVVELRETHVDIGRDYLVLLQTLTG